MKTGPEQFSALGASDESGRGWRKLTNFSGETSPPPSTWEGGQVGDGIKGALAPAQLSTPLEASPAILTVSLVSVGQQQQACDRRSPVGQNVAGVASQGGRRYHSWIGFSCSTFPSRRAQVTLLRDGCHGIETEQTTILSCSILSWDHILVCV